MLKVHDSLVTLTLVALWRCGAVRMLTYADVC
jgi:hypothetical protein